MSTIPSGDLSRLRAARLQARRCCDFHEENLEKLASATKAEQEGLEAARGVLAELERRIGEATTPEVPILEDSAAAGAAAVFGRDSQP